MQVVFLLQFFDLSSLLDSFLSLPLLLPAINLSFISHSVLSGSDLIFVVFENALQERLTYLYTTLPDSKTLQYDSPSGLSLRSLIVFCAWKKFDVLLRSSMTTPLPQTYTHFPPDLREITIATKS